LVKKIVRLCNSILIIGRNRKQKAQKAVVRTQHQHPTISEEKIMSLTPKDQGRSSARRGKTSSKSQATEPTDAKATGIQLYQPQYLHDNRPVGPDDFTISETVSMSGNRPIGTSTLHISETYGIVGNRPVEASDLEVVGTIGRRPIGSSAMQVSEMFSMSGARPIGISNLHIDEVYSTMGGNRPIASNEIDDSSALMGFLD